MCSEINFLIFRQACLDKLYCKIFTFNFMNSFCEIVNELAINLALSTNLILWDIVTKSSLPSLSIFVTSFSVGAENFSTFVCFPQDIQIVLQALLIILL